MSKFMKKYKDDIKSIIEVLTYILVIICFGIIDNPIFTFISIVIWVVVLVYSLYSKIQYRNGSTNCFLFRTKNDSYSTTTSITLGIIILALSVAWFIWVKSINIYGIIGLAIGLLVFLNGLYDLPLGRMQIENNELIISDLESKLDIRQIKEIIIKKDQLILVNHNEEKQRINNLEIDAESASQMKNYIIKHTKNSDLKLLIDI